MTKLNRIVVPVVLTALSVIVFHLTLRNGPAQPAAYLEAVWNPTETVRKNTDKEPLCRQYGYCGMEDMQLAYEGHYFSAMLGVTEIKQTCLRMCRTKV